MSGCIMCDYILAEGDMQLSYFLVYDISLVWFCWFDLCMGTSISGSYELHWTCNKSLGFALGFASLHFACEFAFLIESAVAYLQVAYSQWITLTDECSHLCVFIYIFIAAE